MELWQTIAATVLGNAAVLAVLGWLGKSLLEKLLQRDTKRFEIELKAKADTTMEQLKNDLQIRTIEHQVRFSRLHEKQATVIAELNGLIVESLWEAQSFLSLAEWAGEPNKREKHLTAMNKLAELYRFFDKHRIYLPESLCGVVHQLVVEVRKHVINLGVYVKFEEHAMQEHTRDAKYKVWMEGWEAITEQVPPVVKKLEIEFRALLGSTYA